MDQFPAIIVIAPLIATFFIFFLGWQNQRLAFPLALSGLSVCVLAAVVAANTVVQQGPVQYRFGGWPPPWGIEYRVDHLTVFMLILISLIGWLSAIYAQKSVEQELPDKVSLFWSLYMLLITGLLGIVITGDMFNLFVLLEVASISGYALVAIGRGRAPFASFRYLIIGTIGTSFYLLGIGFLYIVTGSLNMEDLRLLLPPIYGSRVVQAAFVFIFIGFAVKIALFPLHGWQPDVYTYAPSAVSVIISTAAAKTFVYALIRIVFSVFTLDFITGILSVFSIICWVAAVAMIVGSIFAIAQYNLKRMLAYSSIANIGYIILALGLAPSTSLGLSPAVMHIANHAVIKGCMFMTACGFIYKYDLKDIRYFTGLGRRMPYTSLGLILASLAMIGMPPGSGFVTKWYLIRAALEARSYWFVAVIFVSTLLMIVYFWRVIEIMYIRHETESAVESAGNKNRRIAGEHARSRFDFGSYVIPSGYPLDIWYSRSGTCGHQHRFRTGGRAMSNVLYPSGRPLMALAFPTDVRLLDLYLPPSAQFKRRRYPDRRPRAVCRGYLHGPPHIGWSHHRLPHHHHRRRLGYRIPGGCLWFDFRHHLFLSLDFGITLLHWLYAGTERACPDTLLFYVRPGDFFSRQYCVFRQSGDILHFLRSPDSVHILVGGTPRR